MSLVEETVTYSRKHRRHHMCMCYRLVTFCVTVRLRSCSCISGLSPVVISFYEPISPGCKPWQKLRQDKSLAVWHTILAELGKCKQVKQPGMPLHHASRRSALTMASSMVTTQVCLKQRAHACNLNKGDVTVYNELRDIQCSRV